MEFHLDKIDNLFLIAYLEINKPTDFYVKMGWKKVIKENIAISIKSKYNDFKSKYGETNESNVGCYFNRKIVKVKVSQRKINRISGVIPESPLFILFNKKWIYGFDPFRIRATHPIKMSFQQIATMYNVPKFDMESSMEIEDEYKININFYQMSNEKHGKDKKYSRGARVDNALPGINDTHEKTIRIGLDEDTWWLPSENLIDNRLYCSNDKCQFSTHFRPDLDAHEAVCTDETTVISKQVKLLIYNVYSVSLLYFRNSMVPQYLSFKQSWMLDCCQNHF